MLLVLHQLQELLPTAQLQRGHHHLPKPGRRLRPIQKTWRRKLRRRCEPLTVLDFEHHLEEKECGHLGFMEPYFSEVDQARPLGRQLGHTDPNPPWIAL